MLFVLTAMPVLPSSLVGNHCKMVAISPLIIPQQAPTFTDHREAD